MYSLVRQIRRIADQGVQVKMLQNVRDAIQLSQEYPGKGPNAEEIAALTRVLRDLNSLPGDRLALLSRKMRAPEP